MAKEYFVRLSEFILVSRLKDNSDVDLEVKHFFSGAALYANKKICLIFGPEGMAIKFPQIRRDSLIANKLAIPFKYYEKSPIKKEYALFTMELESDRDLYRAYLEESINSVLNQPD